MGLGISVSTTSHVNNWHQRVSLKLGDVKSYSWGITTCLPPESTVWPTVIIKACESKACHSESMGQRGQCSISRDLGTLCEDEEVTWDKGDDNTDLETCACCMFCWLVTEFSNLFSVLHEILAFSLHQLLYRHKKWQPSVLVGDHSR